MSTQSTVREERLITVTKSQKPVGFRIPDPPKGMFTEQEWAAMQIRRAERERTGRIYVGDL